MTPAQQIAVNRISRSLLARVAELHATDPVQVELIVAGAVDFLAACVATLQAPAGPIRDGLLNVVTETLKDRVAEYHTLPSPFPGKVH